MSEIAILSAQNIAQQFSVVREELLAQMVASEAANLKAIDHMRKEMDARVATLEALSLGTLLRLVFRKITRR